MATTKSIIFKGFDLHQARYCEQKILRNDVNKSVCSKNIKFLLLILQNMTKLRFITHVIVALLLGMVFHNFGDDAQKVDSNIAFLFFLLLFLFFSNSMPVVQMCK